MKDLKILVFDDAERLLDTDTEQVVNQIIELLPKRKQTVILATTALPGHVTETLNLKKPISVNAEGESEEETKVVGDRVQGYVIIEPDKRFLLLFSFLKKFQKKKVIVVMSSTAAAKAYGDILNAMGLLVLNIHGKQTTQKRAANLVEFKNAEQATLVCTDAVVQNLEVCTIQSHFSFPYYPTHDEKKLVRVNEVD